jgi:hypothetical protein
MPDHELPAAFVGEPGGVTGAELGILDGHGAVGDEDVHQRRVGQRQAASSTAADERPGAAGAHADRAVRPGGVRPDHRTRRHPQRRTTTARRPRPAAQLGLHQPVAPPVP